MKNKNNYWIIAGFLNLGVFFLHLIGGQITLVEPLLNSTLTLQESTEWLGAWHMVTVILLVTSYILLSAGFGKKYALNIEMIKLIGYLQLIFCFPFIIASLYYGVLAPQWTLFLVIGTLILIGIKKGVHQI